MRQSNANWRSFTNYCIGTTRELCAASSREYQEGRLHTYNRWAYGLWQEPHAESGRITRCAANIGYYSN